MKNLAIIPARGGSKRIPGKNIKDFLGKPIIAYSIETALASDLFDEVMVSTDDPEIAKIALKYNAKVPFTRSGATSNDYANLADVIIEVIENYKKQDVNFDNVCCILATAPFIDKDILSSSFNKLSTNNFESVFPVVKYSFPIQRSLHFNRDKIEMLWPENMNTRSQDLEETFHDAGLFYWIKTDAILEQRKLWTKNASAIVINDQMAQDIDTPEDWALAEVKYKLLYD